MIFILLVSLAEPPEVSNAGLKQLQGKWEIVQFSNKATGSVAEYMRSHAKGAVLIVEKDRCGMEGSDKGLPLRLKVDPSKSPKQIDIDDPYGGRGQAIYEIDGDLLTVCLGDNELIRPSSFEVKDGSTVVRLKRKK